MRGVFPPFLFLCVCVRLSSSKDFFFSLTNVFLVKKVVTEGYLKNISSLSLSLSFLSHYFSLSFHKQKKRETTTTINNNGIN